MHRAEKSDAVIVCEQAERLSQQQWEKELLERERRLEQQEEPLERLAKVEDVLHARILAVEEVSHTHARTESTLLHLTLHVTCLHCSMFPLCVFSKTYTQRSQSCWSINCVSWCVCVPTVKFSHITPERFWIRHVSKPHSFVFLLSKDAHCVRSHLA